MALRKYLPPSGVMQLRPQRLVMKSLRKAGFCDRSEVNWTKTNHGYTNERRVSRDLKPSSSDF